MQDIESVPEQRLNVLQANISKEMKTSYLAYAMSVISGRALPDVRDGLKPVQRRILYSMMELSLWANKPSKKCARIVGEAMGKYHPHGDSAVYEALVRMAQDFSLRYTLVKGQGNFGSIDGDNAAAQRYTEAKLDKIAEEMLVDIEKNTVEFVPNYDNTLKEPTVLPSKIPNLIINGVSGIAVGMATNIPTHNLSEISDALLLLLDRPYAEVQELLEFVKGPDFPTGCTILNQYDLKNIYETGRGSIYVRANYEIEKTAKGKNKIVFTEIPYKVNKSNVITQIAKLVSDGIIKGVSDLRDESNKQGIRIVLELSNNGEPDFIVNNILKHTELETSFPANFLVLDKGQPKQMSLKEILQAYLDHRIEVTKNWLAFDIDKLQKKLHILEGLMIAIKNIDEAIEIIKSSADPKIAKDRLCDRFKLDEIQSQAILDMKLQKLTGLEIDNLKKDYDETKKTIENYKSILADPIKLKELIKNEIIDIKNKYGDARKTLVTNEKTTKNVDMREFIENKKEAIVLTNNGYLKRMSLDEYHTQNRAGKGVKASKLDDDSIKDFVVANTHDVIYLFTTLGRLYTMDCYTIPEASRTSKGRHLANVLKLEDNEEINNLIGIDVDVIENSSKYQVILVTKNGKIKKMAFDLIKKIRANGLRVITLNDNDDLVNVKLVEDNTKIFITSRAGKAVLFDPKLLRAMGRTAAGVKAMNLSGSEIVSVNVVKDDDKLLFVSKLGYGKITAANEFRETNRGAKGTIAMNIKNAGEIIKTLVINDANEIVVITKLGSAIRVSLDQLPELSRNTKGVRIIKLNDKDFVSDVDKISETSKEEGDLNE